MTQAVASATTPAQSPTAVTPPPATPTPTAAVSPTAAASPSPVAGQRPRITSLFVDHGGAGVIVIRMETDIPTTATVVATHGGEALAIWNEKSSLTGQDLSARSIPSVGPLGPTTGVVMLKE